MRGGGGAAEKRKLRVGGEPRQEQVTGGPRRYLPWALSLRGGGKTRGVHYKVLWLLCSLGDRGRRGPGGHV